MQFCSKGFSKTIRHIMNVKSLPFCLIFIGFVTLSQPKRYERVHALNDPSACALVLFDDAQKKVCVAYPGARRYLVAIDQKFNIIKSIRTSLELKELCQDTSHLLSSLSHVIDCIENPETKDGLIEHLKQIHAAFLIKSTDQAMLILKKKILTYLMATQEAKEYWQAQIYSLTYSVWKYVPKLISRMKSKNELLQKIMSLNHLQDELCAQLGALLTVHTSFVECSTLEQRFFWVAEVLAKSQKILTKKEYMPLPSDFENLLSSLEHFIDTLDKNTVFPVYAATVQKLLKPNYVHDNLIPLMLVGATGAFIGVKICSHLSTSVPMSKLFARWKRDLTEAIKGPIVGLKESFMFDEDAKFEDLQHKRSMLNNEEKTFRKDVYNWWVQMNSLANPEQKRNALHACTHGDISEIRVLIQKNQPNLFLSIASPINSYKGKKLEYQSHYFSGLDHMYDVYEECIPHMKNSKLSLALLKSLPVYILGALTGTCVYYAYKNHQQYQRVVLKKYIKKLQDHLLTYKNDSEPDLTIGYTHFMASMLKKYAYIMPKDLRQEYLQDVHKISDCHIAVEDKYQTIQNMQNYYPHLS